MSAKSPLAVALTSHMQVRDPFSLHARQGIYVFRFERRLARFGTKYQPSSHAEYQSKVNLIGMEGWEYI